MKERGKKRKEREKKRKTEGRQKKTTGKKGKQRKEKENKRKGKQRKATAKKRKAKGTKRTTEGKKTKGKYYNEDKRKRKGTRGKLNLEVIVFGVSLYCFTWFRKDPNPEGTRRLAPEAERLACWHDLFETFDFISFDFLLLLLFCHYCSKLALLLYGLVGTAPHQPPAAQWTPNLHQQGARHSSAPAQSMPLFAQCKSLETPFHSTQMCG